MKTQIITIILFFSTLFLLSAQDQSTKQSNSGIKGGYNLSAVSFDGEGETGQRHSFHIGFYSESFLSNAISLQPELLYSQQGYEIRNSNSTFTQKLNYVNFPIMLKAYPSTNFFLETGPQIGLAISHKEELDSSILDTTEEYDPSSFDWGINFGGGFKTETGVSLGVRYHLGLGDIYEDDNPKNRIWQFYLGFDF